MKAHSDSNQQPTDQELLAAFRSRDDRALGMLINRDFQKLVWFSITFVKDKMAAEEIVNNVFIRLWENDYKHLKEVSNLTGYLIKSTRFGSYNYLDAEVRLRKRNEALTQFLFAHQPDHISPDYNLLTAGVLDKLSEEIQKLTPRLREIFWLRMENEYSNKEIADRLNLEEKTVRNQYNSAVKKLKEAILKMMVIILLYFNNLF